MDEPSEVGPGGPFVFRGRLTEDDAVDMRRCQLRLLFRAPFRWLAVGLAATVAGIAVWDIAHNGPEVPPVVCLVALAFLVFVLPRIPAWSTRQHYRLHSAEFLEAEVRIAPDRVSIATEAYRTEFAWKLLGGVVDAPRGVLFFDGVRRSLFWLPNRVFEDDALRRRVLALASLNGVRVHRG